MIQATYIPSSASSCSLVYNFFINMTHKAPNGRGMARVASTKRDLARYIVVVVIKAQLSNKLIKVTMCILVEFYF
jgi:hypothetical protein